MPNSEKGFSQLILIGVIAVLLIGGIWYFRNTQNNTSPTTTPINQNSLNTTTQTSDLKTYKNSLLGLEFQYDQNSELLSATNEGAILKITLRDNSLKKDNQYVDDVPYFYLVVSNDNKNAGCEGVGINPEKVTIAGEEATYFEELKPMPTMVRGFCLVHNEYTYKAVNKITYEEHLEKTSKLFDIIKNSFKFTDSTANSIEQELENVPIYPGAQFVTKEDRQYCKNQDPESCSPAALYTYEIAGVDRVKIVNWYENDESQLGWKVSGGGGCVAPAICSATFSKDGDPRQFQLSVIDIAPPNNPRVHIYFAQYKTPAN